MTASSLIAIDSRPVEHLRLPDGFLSLLTGTVLRLYGERICWGKLPSDKPFFVAAYFLPSLTYYVSALVDPSLFADELHDEDIEFGRDEPMVDEAGFVISATITNEFVTEPFFVGYKTTVLLDSHFEGSPALREAL
ncbi:MAG TPA: hypothetical protein VMS09_05020 [Paenibacillus sp.]|uniref:hypothetical protein n=2 Tax=Paenibacillus TaxID=44249 RepID=UPI002D00FCAB|nr:hypothetical protein [Paenibacillus sp.]HUC91379.1 hypothetical protein [Paenibacillus sp.]